MLTQRMETAVAQPETPAGFEGSFVLTGMRQTKTCNNVQREELNEIGKLHSLQVGACAYVFGLNEVDQGPQNKIHV